ncbi:bifunctional hydroxymethylpyrimidine kinase/phosphomethylpyrimidine kinase [Gemmatimonas sp.]|uniref:bifunctional hydroxymethylpyrimidine kinase/phosphomethylpyrimidine kinase n=1 Tax=Gemmatimonas sp. TaxID=1962908 RepID=UPI00333E72D4
MIPNILAIAGSDPSGGAGIQADIKSISANGGYAMAVITALTAQNTQRVSAVELVTPAMIGAQIEAIRSDITVHAIKTGMLGSAEIIRAVLGAIDGLRVPLVIDPVMVSKSGHRLLLPDAVTALREMLPRATVITPNLPEAADLLLMPEATSRDEMAVQAQALMRLGPQAVLLKGGHLAGAESSDLLATRDGLHWLDGPRHHTRNTHGTGCTLSSALATLLGHGASIADAAARAKRYVADAIAHADALTVGTGHGPVHHFHSIFKDTTA